MQQTPGTKTPHGWIAIKAWERVELGLPSWDDKYLRDTTAQFYARRFVIAYPNEELPAGRPLKTTPSYEAQKALGARFGAGR